MVDEETTARGHGGRERKRVHLPDRNDTPRMRREDDDEALILLNIPGVLD